MSTSKQALHTKQAYPNMEEIQAMPAEEVVAKRTRNAKVFSLGRNLYQTVVHAEPLHYWDKQTTRWEAIDNTLIEKTDGEGRLLLENRANGHLRVQVTDTSQEWLVKLENEAGQALAWRIEDTGPKARQLDAQGTAQRVLPVTTRHTAWREGVTIGDRMHNALEEAHGKATYCEILPGIDLRCEASGDHFKDEIVYKDADAVRPITFLMRAPGQTLALQADQSIDVAGKGGGASFHLPAPFMLDAQGREGAVAVTLQSAGKDTWRMVYQPDMAWMETAAFPVTLDPVVYTYSSHTSAYQMRTVDTTTPDTVISPIYKSTITNSDGTYRRLVLLRFFPEHFPAIDHTCRIIDGSITMSTSGTLTQMQAYVITDNWNYDLLTYNNMPNYNKAIIDRSECGTDSWISHLDVLCTYDIPATFSMTQVINNWYREGSSKGLVFSSSRGNVSLSNPYMCVTYLDMAGLEDHLSYDTHGLGRAGQAHINLFTGNLIYSHQDTACGGSRMPVSVSHYYNSCHNDMNICNAGLGWKHSLTQTLHIEKFRTSATGSASATVHYVYTDGDGTKHFFKAGTNDYVDDGGKNLTLKVNSANITITDKSDNVLTFAKLPTNANGPETNVMLQKMTDAQGNTITLSTDTTNRVTSATDGTGRITTFTYNEDGLLSAINAPGFEDTGVHYAYDEAGHLTSITYEDGVVTTFTYNEDGLLEEAQNQDGRILHMTYDEPFQCVAMVQREPNPASPSYTKTARKYEYGSMLTTVIDGMHHSDTDMQYHFNPDGNMIAANNMEGGGAVAKYVTEYPLHQPESVSKQQKPTINKLRNQTFVRSEDWTFEGSVGYASGSVAMMGGRCLRFYNTYTGDDKYAYQNIWLIPGKTYTISAYAKRQGDIDMHLSYTCRGGPDLGRGMAGSSPSLKHQIGEEYGRVSYTFTAPSHESYTYYTIYIGASGEHNVEGTLWVDCIQLEEGAAPSHYNLIENSDFGWATYADPSGEGIGTPNFWTKLAHATADDGALSSFPAHAEGARALPSTSCLRMQGSYAKSNMGFYQDLPLSGAKDDVFVLGGWAKAISIARRTAKKHFGLRLSFLSGTNTYTDATSEVQWNAEWTSWQYTFGPVIAPKAYTGVRVYIDYCRNENEALFTNLFLYKDTFGWSYKYDANGNLLSATGLNKQASQATYDASHNLTKYTAPGATASTLLEYALGAKKHLVTKITSPMAVITEYEYDSVGNRTSSKVSCATASEGFIQSMVTYDDNKNHAISAKDARGFIIRKEVDPTTDLLKSVTDPLGQQVGYTYDTRRRMTAAGAMACNKYHANSYTYEYDRLVEASHNTTDNRQNDVVYRFAYNDFGNQTSVSVGDQVLSTSVYAQDDPRMLDGVDYGNGGQVRYQRDHLKRITGVTWDGGATPDYETIYNSNGNPALTKDHALNRETRTEFDLCERPMRTITTEAGQPLHEYQVAYDTTNRVETMKEFLDGEQKFAASFAYDKGGRPTALTYTEGTATKDRLEITYDKLGRTSARKLKQTGKTDYTVSYKYAAGGHGALSTTGLISEIILPGETIKYTYDERGNITAETRGTLTTRYQYDALGQLIRVDDPHAELTTTFMYDRGGNILCKTEYAYTPGTYLLPPEDRTVHYTYGDAAWKDKLTAYDGVPITYDAIGNPLNDGKWTYTWQHGRQLAAITSEDDSISFQYNSAGLRVRKTSASRGTTEYTLRGTQVVRLQRSNVDMHFWYDECGHPTLVKYGDSYYGYEYNVQGDVIGLVDRASSNARAVRYAYDAWGRPVSCTGDLAETLGKENPFRYRGYLFDEETGWYALHARYYLPEQARFLNTDIILGNVGRLFTHNVFTYCYNNPANLYDPSGMTPQWTDPKYIAAMEEHARKLLEKIEKDKASAAKKSNSGGNGNSKASVGAANISNESTQTLLDSWQDAIDRKFKKDLEIIAAAQASPKLMERHFPDWYEKARAEQQAQEEEAYRLAHEEEERKAAIWGALQEGMDNTNTRFRNVFDFFGTSHFEDQSDMLPEHQIMPSSPYR